MMNEPNRSDMYSETRDTPPLPGTTETESQTASDKQWPPVVRRVDGLFSKFMDEFKPMDKRCSPATLIDAALKRPARVVHEIVHGNSKTRVNLMLLAVMAACYLAYGLIMATFSGGYQLWAVPVKVVSGILMSGLICLPSLYVFSALAGGNQSPAQVAGLLLLSLALTGILLIGFAPIAWLFSQSTKAVSFMASLHLVFWMIGAVLGLRLLLTAFAHLNQRSMSVLRVWSVIFVLVVLQMCTVLRPLVGEYRQWQPAEKQFFLAHWGRCLDDTQ